MTIKGFSDQITEDTLKRKLLNYFNEDHKLLITEIKKTKRKDLVVIACDTWNSAKIIAATYKDKFDGHEVSFSLFSKVDPALKTKSN